MNHSVHRPHGRIAQITTVVLLWLAALMPLLAQPDSTNLASTVPQEAILFTGRLDFDTLADTVFGRRGADHGYLPARIHWGSLRKPVTTLRYPSWGALSGGVSFIDLNSDGVSDIMLHIWGNDGDTTVSRSLVIFGQNRLQKLSLINLAQIKRVLQEHPFVAIDLRLGEELTESKARDLSGRPSHRLKRIAIDVRDSSGAPGAPQTSSIVEPWINIYPNPAVYATNVDAQRVAPGEYHVALVATSGRIYFEQRVTVDDSGLIFRTIDLDDVPSGYYIVRLHAGDRMVGTYPVVIMH